MTKNKNYITNKELIAHLQTLPEDAICYVLRDGNDHATLVNIVDVKVDNHPYFSGDEPEGVSFNEETQVDEFDDTKKQVQYLRVGICY